MAKKHESNWNIEDLTDWEVYDAIRYLEPDPLGRKQEDNVAGFVLWISLWILLLAGVGFVCLYRF